MDPTGFAVGVIGLTSVVSTCIETFKIVRSIRAYGHDAEIIILKLGIERDLFIQWAYNAGLLQKHYVKANIFNPSRDKLIHDVLIKIKQLLYESESLARKYGMIEDDPWKSGFDCEKNVRERGWCHCHQHNRRHRHRNDQKRASSSLSQSPPRKVSLPRKVMWTIHAKDEFQDLIDQLHYFIERLDQMVKSVDQRRTLMKDLRGLGADFSKLDLIDDNRNGRQYEDWSDVMSVFSDGESDDGPNAVKARDKRRSRARSRSQARNSDTSRSSGRSQKSERNRQTHDDIAQEVGTRSHSGYERPQSYHSLHGDRSPGSRKSSRSTFSDMIGDLAGSRSKGRSIFC